MYALHSFYASPFQLLVFVWIYRMNRDLYEATGVFICYDDRRRRYVTNDFVAPLSIVMLCLVEVRAYYLFYGAPSIEPTDWPIAIQSKSAMKNISQRNWDCPIKISSHQFF